jgi:hypothetical protein
MGFEAGMLMLSQCAVGKAQQDNNPDSGEAAENPQGLNRNVHRDNPRMGKAEFGAFTRRNARRKFSR